MVTKKGGGFFGLFLKTKIHFFSLGGGGDPLFFIFLCPK